VQSKNDSPSCDKTSSSRRLTAMLGPSRFGGSNVHYVQILPSSDPMQCEKVYALCYSLYLGPPLPALRCSTFYFWKRCTRNARYTQGGEIRPNCTIALVEHSSFVSLICAYLTNARRDPCRVRRCRYRRGRLVDRKRTSFMLQRRLGRVERIDQHLCRLRLIRVR